MFCNKCGNPIAEGNAFCTACGQAVDPAAQQQTAPQPEQIPQQPYNQPVYSLGSYTSHFRQTWRTFACGTLALVLLILQSATIVMAFADASSLTSSLNVMFAALGREYMSALQAFRSMIVGMVFVAMIPSILHAIGMWMLYMDARDKSDRPIKTSGLKLIRGVEIASAVISGLMILILFLLLNTMTQIITSAGAYYGGFDFGEQAMIDSIMSTFYGIIVVTVGFAIFVYVMEFKLINAMIKSLESNYPATKGLTFFAVLSFISGGISVLSLMGSDIMISSVISCATTIVMGVVLLKYKEMMNQLQADRAKFDTNYTYQ